MKLISRIRHGEPFKAALFAKVNEIVDYLLATRIVVGPGLRISETPNGLVLSITRRQTTGRSAAGTEIISGGTYSYAGAFAVEMETGGTTCRVYNGALPASEHAGKLRLGTQVFSVPSEENIPAVIASGATSCTLYLMVSYSGGGYHSSYVTTLPAPSDPQTWYTELAVLDASGLHQMHLSGNIEISGRWFGPNHSLWHEYNSGESVSAEEETGSSRGPVNQATPGRWGTT